MDLENGSGMAKNFPGVCWLSGGVRTNGGMKVFLRCPSMKSLAASLVVAGDSTYVEPGVRGVNAL